MQEDVKEIWHKKVKFIICKECRKKLASNKLEELFNKKRAVGFGCSPVVTKPIECGSPIPDRNKVFCDTCFTMVAQISANFEKKEEITGRTIWICDDCKKKKREEQLLIDGKVLCPLCEKNEVYVKDLITYQGIDKKICIGCVKELTTKGSIIKAAGRENGGIEIKEGSLN
jgi:RNase P subunit RPR2